MPALVPDNDDALSITVNLKNNQEEIIYSSQWSLRQLEYVKYLYDQYNLTQDTIVEINHPIVIKKYFKTIETAVKSLAQQKTEERQLATLQKLFKTQHYQKNAVALLKASDFLNVTPIFNACLRYLSAKTLQLTQNNQLSAALTLLDDIDNATISIVLGNHILKNSQEIHHLLIRLNQEYIVHKKKTHASHPNFIPVDTLIFRSGNYKRITFWHNHTLTTFATPSTENLYTACICSKSNKLFCLFRNNIQLYDLQGNFLATRSVKLGTRALTYSHQRNVLNFIQDHWIYSLTPDNFKSKP